MAFVDLGTLFICEIGSIYLLNLLFPRTPPFFQKKNERLPKTSIKDPTNGV